MFDPVRESGKYWKDGWTRTVDDSRREGADQREEGGGTGLGGINWVFQVGCEMVSFGSWVLKAIRETFEKHAKYSRKAPYNGLDKESGGELYMLSIHMKSILIDVLTKVHAPRPPSTGGRELSFLLVPVIDTTDTLSPPSVGLDR